MKGNWGGFFFFFNMCTFPLHSGFIGILRHGTFCLLKITSLKWLIMEWHVTYMNSWCIKRRRRYFYVHSFDYATANTSFQSNDSVVLHISPDFMQIRPLYPDCVCRIQKTFTLKRGMRANYHEDNDITTSTIFTETTMHLVYPPSPPPPKNCSLQGFFFI